MRPLPILYSFRRCPYAIRARLAIASSGRTVELREVVLRDKAPEFLATSPSATVPCLKDGETVLDESLDIMLWALGRADPEGWLEPEEGGLETALDLIGTCDGPFKHRLDRYKYDTRYDGAVKETERARASEFLWRLDKCLAGGGSGKPGVPRRFRHPSLCASVRQHRPRLVRRRSLAGPEGLACRVRSFGPVSIGHAEVASLAGRRPAGRVPAAQEGLLKSVRTFFGTSGAADDLISALKSLMFFIQSRAECPVAARSTGNLTKL